jgi:hypothetical protein
MPIRHIDFVMAIAKMLPDLNHNLFRLLGVEPVHIARKSPSNAPTVIEALHSTVSTGYNSSVWVLVVVGIAMCAADDGHTTPRASP